MRWSGSARSVDAIRYEVDGHVDQGGLGKASR